MDHVASWPFLLVVLLLALGCQTEESPAPSAELVNVPAVPGSGQPHLFAGEDGTVWMSWVEPQRSGQASDSSAGERHALRYATFDGASWTGPHTVAEGTDWFVNWADVPSLRPLPDGRLAAHYLRSNGPNPLAYEVRITQTTPEGMWQPAVVPHGDGTETEHGFVSLLPWSENRLLAVWLDGRNMAGEGGGHQGEMTLRGGVLDASGTVERQALLDERTCECCPTSAVRTDDEALVAYRDRTEEEIRNIKLVRYDGQSWSEPALLHDDGWQIEGCPVNGPALAARGEGVAAAWFTAAGGRPQVKVAFSEDGGRTFGTPTVVAGSGAEGRVALLLSDDGTAVVSWLGQGEETAALRARRVRPDGSTAPPATIAPLASTSRGVGMPRMVETEDHLYAAWTRPESAGDDAGVRLARMPVEAVR